MNITFVGYGNVGLPLASQIEQLGHNVTLAARNPNSDSTQKALAVNANLHVDTPSSAVQKADIIFLATPFGSNQTIIEGLQSELEGKILVDCTNPVGKGFTHGLNNEQSGAEFIQSMIPNSHVVKAFSVYGYENLKDNHYPDYNLKPAMFFCGDNEEAKSKVGQLIESLGWEPLDVGVLKQALHLEHMTLMWVRMIRMGRLNPNLVWGAIRRDSQ